MRSLSLTPPRSRRTGRDCKTAEDFLAIVGEALRQMYGLAGGAMDIEAVQFSPARREAILSVANECAPPCSCAATTSSYCHTLAPDQLCLLPSDEAFPPNSFPTGT